MSLQREEPPQGPRVSEEAAGLQREAEALRAAILALRRGEDAIALNHLREAWEVFRRHRLEQRLTRLAGHLAQTRPPLEPVDQWAAIECEQLARRGWLCDLDRMEKWLRPRSLRWKRPALQNFMLWPPDPRVGALVEAETFAVKSPNGKTTSLWRRLLARHGDRRRLEALALRVPSHWQLGGLALTAPKVPGVVPKAMPALDEALELALQRPPPSEEALAAQLDPEAAEERALIQMVLDEPGEDALRVIYGDWLAERDRPRGEAIQKELAGLRTGGIVDKWWRAWLGEHAAAVLPGTTFFRLGFLDAATLTSPDLEAPIWRTLTRLNAGHQAFDHPNFRGVVEAGYLDDAAHPTIRTLVRPHTLDRMARRPLPFTSISMDGPNRVLDRLDLPELHTLNFVLRFRDSALDALRLTQRVTTLRLFYNRALESVTPLLELPALQRLMFRYEYWLIELRTGDPVAGIRGVAREPIFNHPDPRNLGPISKWLAAQGVKSLVFHGRHSPWILQALERHSALPIRPG